LGTVLFTVISSKQEDGSHDQQHRQQTTPTDGRDEKGVISR
jgi:hypothetical protein